MILDKQDDVLIAWLLLVKAQFGRRGFALKVSLEEFPTGLSLRRVAAV